MDIPTWVGIVGIVVGILAALGGGAGYFKSKAGEKLIELQDKTIKEQANRIDLVERDRAECRQRLDALQDIVTGEVAIGKLTDIVEDGQKEILKRLDDLRSTARPKAKPRSRR